MLRNIRAFLARSKAITAAGAAVFSAAASRGAQLLMTPQIDESLVSYLKHHTDPHNAIIQLLGVSLGMTAGIVLTILGASIFAISNEIPQGESPPADNKHLTSPKRHNVFKMSLGIHPGLFSFGGPMFLRKVEAWLLNMAVMAAVAHRDEAIAAVGAVAAAANGSPSQDHINQAIEKIVPIYLRPLVDSELKQIEGQGMAQLGAGAPAFVDAAIAALKNAAAKLA